MLRLLQGDAGPRAEEADDFGGAFSTNWDDSTASAAALAAPANAGVVATAAGSAGAAASGAGSEPRPAVVRYICLSHYLYRYHSHRM
jgi:hypothetical protein